MTIKVKVRLPSRYILLGTGLALMLQTNYRFLGPVGVGEIFAMLYFSWVILSALLIGGRPRFRKPDGLTASFLAILVLIITPMTVLSYAMNTPGSSFRDLISYYFVCAVLLTLPHAERDVRTLIKTFLVVLFVTIGVQYFLGGASAYYFSRFTGGAQNPNQLALYLVSATLLSACLPDTMYRICIVLLSLFFGIASLSDAYLISLLVTIIGFTTLTVFPPRAVRLTLPVLLFLSYIAITFSGLLEFFIEQWRIADQGDARTQLYFSALKAWMSTPFSFIFGHGAGSFSGINNAFGLAEAHNTVLDLAAVAGIFGLFLFPVRPLQIAMASLSRNYRFAPAVFMGLVAFAFFHFVGRQPIFWVSVVIYARLVQSELAMQRLVGKSELMTKGAKA